ncbi:MAG: Protein of unknown function (DUF1553)/Protein of unknown function (DUF1549)/Planctomycete [Planctomycetaceae bacterium]|nr:Protein of unknown function (DUF1553)/Protein of unknown function (DUF1549)/Planctomycete [Planctomycetaceae bacterium]
MSSIRNYLIGLLLWLAVAGPSRAENEVDFGRDVAPIFEKRCLLCHRSGDPAGELSLSTGDDLTELGYIEPGKPESSHLLKVLIGSNGKRPLMPKTGDPLSPAQIDVLTRWIKSGAKWPAEAKLPRLWSLASLSQPVIPEMVGADAGQGGGQSPIDRFVRRRLMTEGLEPAPQAARAELVRRLKFDLLGLPPTPDEIDAFVTDSRADAFSRLVERYLASPQYGERWGRHWLDVVRFGESDGFEDDDPRNQAWPYRDYVIRSLNADKPYDQFVREQVAGDVLEPVTTDGTIATTMLVNGPFDRSAAVSASKVERLRSREENLEEMLTTVGQTFLGLTVNCARCHDHKFDPIPQTDYYRMKAVFEGVLQSLSSRFEPSLVLSPADVAEHARLQAETIRLADKLGHFKTDQAAIEDDLNSPLLDRAAALWHFNGGGATSQTEPDRKGARNLLEAKWSGRFGMPARSRIAAANSDQRVFDTGEGTITNNVEGGAGYAIIPSLDNSSLLQRGEALSIFTRVRFTGKFNGTDDVLRIGDVGDRHKDTLGFEMVATGENQQQAVARFVVTGKGQTAEIGVSSTTPLSLDKWYDLVGVFADSRLTLWVSDPNTGKVIGVPASKEVPFKSLEAEGKQNLLVFVAPGFQNGPQPGAQMDIAAVWQSSLSPEDVTSLSAQREPDTKQKASPELRLAELATRIAETNKQIAAVKLQIEQLPRALIGVRQKPGPTVVFERGDIRSPGAAVSPGGLSAIHQQPAELGLTETSDEADRRRKFAAWVTDPRNPLTARVIVNRVWQWHFGVGIVDTSSDFGVNGGRPSHPELLDWLATQFIEDGWSLKQLHRRILLSATWQQSSLSNGKAAKIDIDNRLLWRFAPKRLDAESTRDAMLFVSGELNPQIGGPSYQPFTMTKFNTTFYHPIESGEPQYNRRTIYRMSINTGRDPLLDALDCPAPSVLTPVRRQTVTPLQALSLMNDTFVLRQAKKLAERVAAEASKPEQQIVLAWQRALGRAPTPEEAAGAVEMIQDSNFETLCWVLFNSSEFLQVR